MSQYEDDIDYAELWRSASATPAEDLPAGDYIVRIDNARYIPAHSLGEWDFPPAINYTCTVIDSDDATQKNKFFYVEKKLRVRRDILSCKRDLALLDCAIPEDISGLTDVLSAARGRIIQATRIRYQRRNGRDGYFTNFSAAPNNQVPPDETFGGAGGGTDEDVPF